jgi:hypothetical protein
LKLSLIEKVRLALGQDSSIFTSEKDIDKCEPKTTEYMSQLGLEKTDLKKLERKGLALRFYTKNVWLPGEEMPSGKVSKGTYAKVEVEEKTPYTDARGYTRFKRSKVVKPFPDITTRGQGHHVMWILLAKES